jgi:hypothetical protein
MGEPFDRIMVALRAARRARVSPWPGPRSLLGYGRVPATPMGPSCSAVVGSEQAWRGHAEGRDCASAPTSVTRPCAGSARRTHPRQDPHTGRRNSVPVPLLPALTRSLRAAVMPGGWSDAPAWPRGRKLPGGREVPVEFLTDEQAAAVVDLALAIAERQRGERAGSSRAPLCG